MLHPFRGQFHSTIPLFLTVIGRICSRSQGVCSVKQHKYGYNMLKYESSKNTLNH